MVEVTFKNDIDTPVLVAGVVGGVLFLFASVVIITGKKKRRPPLGRSWSYTSEGMRVGCFPEPLNAPPTVINVALYFDDLPSVDDLATQIIQPLLAYERFRLVPSDNGLRESTNKDYKAKSFVRNILVSKPFSVEKLHATIVESLSYPLDKDRDDLPWWEIVRIETPSKEESACVLRVHHCIGDGLSLINIFDQILISDDGSPIESKVTKAMLNRQNASSVSTSSSSSNKSASPSIGSMLSATAHVLGLPASQYDDSTPFRPDLKRGMKYSGNRSYVYFPDVPLDFIKQLKSEAKVSVNDILMFAVSQAIYEYCQSVVTEDATRQKTWNIKQEKIQCRALLPASLPRSMSELKYTPIQNKWCMVSANMHIGFKSSLERLKAIHETTSSLKKTPRAYIQLWVQNNIGPLLGTNLGRQTTNDVFERHSMVLTNIPGPEKICCFAGGRVKSVQMLFPNLIPQISLLSYGGQIHANIVYDPKEMIGDSSILPGLYAKALRGLARELGGIEIPTALK